MEDIKSGVADVRAFETPSNWLLIGHDGVAISAIAKGTSPWTDGVEELVKREFGWLFARVRADDKESLRYKFILAAWAPPSLPLKTKALMSDTKGVVDTVCAGQYGVAITASEKSELAEGVVMTLVKKASGADYDSGEKREDEREFSASKEKTVFTKPSRPGKGAPRLMTTKKAEE